MTGSPVVQRVGHKSRRPSWDWLTGSTWSVERRLPPSVIYNPVLAGPTLDELAAMPPWFALAAFGLYVVPGEWVLYHPDAAARRPEPRRPRTALGSGVVALHRSVSP
ncbi:MULTISPECIES: hypothetical protein [Sorangium]|uniref:hypothetical protein n=1 Tax=Sorangium TaxID=39643 RepID=UPI003D9C0DA8